MKKLFRRLLSFVLVASLLLTSNIQIFAAVEEEYLSDLRLVYAATYDEAKEILNDTDFNDYKLLNENLNEGTKKIGVWLAYKTTTDIEDAITDLSVMQMDGGYKEGNYQEMLKESYKEYVAMGETYLQAIEYFNEAYDADYFLAKSAHRQLNFFTSITDEELNIKIPDFDGELLGDVFYDGIDSDELAVMFMEGNKYALENVRSLLAMGVGYNEDGKNYLQKVSDSALLMNNDATVFEEEDYYELAVLVSGTITTLRNKFKELATVEDQLDYTDEEVTELELKYADCASIAQRMRETEYLDGKSLYDFCLSYNFDASDVSKLYPLVDALNDGQKAMTKVAHFYDVVRYSMSDFPEEIIDKKISELEEVYLEYPFNIYTGVDRSIFRGTYALTSEAYRANAYTESGFDAYLTSGLYGALGIAGIVTGSVGSVLSVWAICRSVKVGLSKWAAEGATWAAQTSFDSFKVSAEAFVAKSKLGDFMTSDLSGFPNDVTCDNVANTLFAKYLIEENPKLVATDYSFETKLNMIQSHFDKLPTGEDIPMGDTITVDYLKNQVNDQAVVLQEDALREAAAATERATDLSNAMHGTTVTLYVVSGIIMFISAVTLGISVYNYYNPEYSDIPVALVDLIETVDGDRYIKYDVVYEAEPREKDVYAAGDLNAFEAERWNALYFTKSYEAGKPLLADEFTLSKNNNKAKDGHTPVHRFGEVVCYDLNKYNFSDKSPSIYLSVKQSKNNKAAVADVPEVVGSIFANGIWLLIGASGALLGVCGTLGTQAIIKKRKPKAQA